MPVKGRDGEIIQMIAHRLMARPRHVVLSGWETGSEPGIGEDLSEPFEVLGEVTAEKVDILQRVDAIFISSLREFGLYDGVSQALAVK